METSGASIPIYMAISTQSEGTSLACFYPLFYLGDEILRTPYFGMRSYYEVI